MLRKILRHSFSVAIAIGFIGMVSISSCATARQTRQPRTITVQLNSTAVPSTRYNGLERSLRLNVVPQVTTQSVMQFAEYPGRQLSRLPDYKVTPEVQDFVVNSLTSYMVTMGLPLVNTSESLSLNVTVREMKIVNTPGGERATVVLDYELLDSDRNILVSRTARGRATGSGGPSAVFDEAYTQALADFDWGSIADALRVAKRASQEPRRQVQGDGDTALENTVIRWYIISSPQGADVSWRVVSSTPDVKNTNASYVGTTPYETTESFDIRGLSAKTAGNVQIEVTCEKPGYLPQRRRFNLRQAIDQKEISAKFNLVKDE